MGLHCRSAIQSILNYAANWDLHPALFGNATPLGPIDMLACVFAPAGTQVDALFLNVTSIP